MAEEIRRQVSKVYGDLLEAVDMLEEAQTNRSGSENSARRSTIQAEQNVGNRASTSQQPVPMGPQREQMGQTTPGSRSRYFPFVSPAPGQTTLPGTSSQSLGRMFNFKPKESKPKSKKKLQMWSHTFVCLARVDQGEVPDSRERAQLKIDGLGEKKCSIFMYAEAEEIQDALMDEFPKLARAGGFELLRQTGNNRLLELIPSPRNGYSVDYLKAVVSNAKIYVRPLQRDLDIDGGDEVRVATVS